MKKTTIQNQDNESVVINVDSEGYAEITNRTFSNGAEIFYLVAETDDDDICIGIFEDRAEAEDALKNLEETNFVAGEGMTAVEYMKKIDEYYRPIYVALETKTALEYVNRQF